MLISVGPHFIETSEIYLITETRIGECQVTSKQGVTRVFSRISAKQLGQAVQEAQFREQKAQRRALLRDQAS